MYTTYEGQQVRLRPFRDLGEASSVFAEENGTPNPHWGPYHEAAAEISGEFSDCALLPDNGRRILCVERLDTGEVVGYEEVGPLSLPRLVAWVGTFIRPAQQRRGFGMEAKRLMFCMLFENMPIESIMADTVATHQRARRGLELCGMRCIGQRPAVHYRHGRYEAVVYHQLLRSDWEAMDYRHHVRRSG